MDFKKHPARIYDLNLLASVLGKIQIEGCGDEGKEEIQKLIDQVIGALMDLSKPLVPHTDKHLLEEAKKFVGKLLGMLNTERSRKVISEIERSKIQKILIQFNEECDVFKRGKSERLISKGSIEAMFQFSSMWEKGKRELEDDLKRWNKKKCPESPASLRMYVDAKETRRLVETIKKSVLGLDILLITKITLTKNPQEHHLFWTITDRGLAYIISENSGLDAQLSFDFPHIVAHLAHLNFLKERGVMAYIDDMATRAFFEAVAVFSEYQIINALKHDSSIATQIQHNLQSKRNINSEQLREWMIGDREFQFRLRNVRLFADLLAIEEVPFLDIVAIASKTLGLPEDIVRSEVLKYFPWTGLGAMYILGYRRLEQSGIVQISDILQENPPATWNEFENRKINLRITKVMPRKLIS